MDIISELDKNKAAFLKDLAPEIGSVLLKGLKAPLSFDERVKIKRHIIKTILKIQPLALADHGELFLLLQFYRILPFWLLPDGCLPAVDETGELFSVVDENDCIMGTAPRRECHKNPLLIHRVAHVLVFNPKGELILQKRSMTKDIQPGKWDTSVGGHLLPDEDYEAGAYRESAEELGITNLKLEFLYKYPLRNQIESENVAAYLGCFDGEIKFDPLEITETRAWTLEEIKGNLEAGIFTPNFEAEFYYYLTHVTQSYYPGCFGCVPHRNPKGRRADWQGLAGLR